MGGAVRSLQFVYHAAKKRKGSDLINGDLGKLVAYKVIDHLEAGDCGHGYLSAILKADVIGLLVPTDPLRRQAQDNEFINPPA